MVCVVSALSLVGHVRTIVYCACVCVCGCSVWLTMVGDWGPRHTTAIGHRKELVKVLRSGRFRGSISFRVTVLLFMYRVDNCALILCIY